MIVKKVKAKLSGKYTESIHAPRRSAASSATITHLRSFSISQVRAESRSVATAHLTTNSNELGTAVAKKRAKFPVLVKFSGT
jgi:hypothetical protein